jgi:hypothetical protein
VFSACTAHEALGQWERTMRNVIYIIGLIVVVIVVLKILGLY